MNTLTQTLSALALLLLASGCQPPPIATKHSNVHSNPKTFAEALDAVALLGTEIVEAFKTGQPEDAHDQLHEIELVIESIPAIAEKAGLAEETKPIVAEATEKLMNAFRALDESLHGIETKSTDDVELEVDWATGIPGEGGFGACWTLGRMVLPLRHLESEAGKRF